MMGEIIKWGSLSEDLQESFQYGDFENEDDFVVVEKGGWAVDYKYEVCTNIFQRKSDGKYFAQDRTRSGSAFSDYYYEDPEDLYEVVKQEVVKHEWKMVK